LKYKQKTNYLVFFIFLGVTASQSACYGLRYRFGAGRTMLAHALRMPNAKEVFF